MSRSPHPKNQNNNNIPLDLNESHKHNNLQVYFSHRSNNSYSLFNEIKLLKPKSNINSNNNHSSFQQMNRKSKSIEKGLSSRLASIEKKLRSKIIRCLEVNLDEEQSNSELLNCNSKSKNTTRRYNKASLFKEQGKSLKLLYKSIDVKKDDLQKYWTHKKTANSNPMNFVQISLKEMNKNMNSALKGNYNSSGPSTSDLFGKMKHKGINDTENSKETYNAKEKLKYSKLFTRIQRKRNCVSHSKRKSIKTSLNSNSINLSLFNKEKNTPPAVVNSLNKNKRQKNKSSLGNNNKSNNTNKHSEEVSLHQKNCSQKDIELEYKSHEIIFEKNTKESNSELVVVNIDEPNDLISPDDEDERISPLCHLPIFAAKKLSYYYSSQLTERKIIRCFSIDNIYHSIHQFLNLIEVTSLSLINRYFEKRTREERRQAIISQVLIQYDQLIKTDNNKIWNNLKHNSQLSLVPYLKKTYLDNAFQQSKYLLDIKKDIIRTYPNDPSFNEKSQLYKQLLYILNAYANYNPKIGYAQGMNFILAKILQRTKSEEEALLFLDAIMSRLHMEAIVGISNQLVMSMNYIGELIFKALPEFDLFLKEHSLSHEVFTANWVITLFASSADNEELYVIWDFIFIFGWKFVHYFIIAIIKTFQQEIITLKFDNYSEEIRQILHSNAFKLQFRKIISLSCDYINKNEFSQ